MFFHPNRPPSLSRRSAGAGKRFSFSPLPSRSHEKAYYRCGFRLSVMVADFIRFHADITSGSFQDLERVMDEIGSNLATAPSLHPLLHRAAKLHAAFGRRRAYALPGCSLARSSRSFVRAVAAAETTAVVTAGRSRADGRTDSTCRQKGRSLELCLSDPLSLSDSD